MFYKITWWMGCILALALLAGCGKSVKKKEMGPDAYFEYAKQKFDKGDYLDAVTEFTVITLRYSGDPIVDDAQYYLAESHFKQKEYLIAISEYRKLINDYPQSLYRVLAQFKIGLAYYKLSLRPELDQEYTRQGIRAFQEFLEENPNHELKDKATEYIAKLREKLAKKQMIGATTYRKMGIYDAALIYYDLILEKYYDTSYAPEAHYWKGESLYRLKRYPEALSALTVYVEKYPRHDHVDEAKARIEKISELVKTTQNDSPNADEANRN